MARFDGNVSGEKHMTHRASRGKCRHRLGQPSQPHPRQQDETRGSALTQQSSETQGLAKARRAKSLLRVLGSSPGEGEVNRTVSFCTFLLLGWEHHFAEPCFLSCSFSITPSPPAPGFFPCSSACQCLTPWQAFGADINPN